MEAGDLTLMGAELLGAELLGAERLVFSPIEPAGSLARARRLVFFDEDVPPEAENGQGLDAAADELVESGGESPQSATARREPGPLAAPMPAEHWYSLANCPGPLRRFFSDYPRLGRGELQTLLTSHLNAPYWVLDALVYRLHEHRAAARHGFQTYDEVVDYLAAHAPIGDSFAPEDVLRLVPRRVYLSQKADSALVPLALNPFEFRKWAECYPDEDASHVTVCVERDLWPLVHLLCKSHHDFLFQRQFMPDFETAFPVFVLVNIAGAMTRAIWKRSRRLAASVRSALVDWRGARLPVNDMLNNARARTFVTWPELRKCKLLKRVARPLSQSLQDGAVFSVQNYCDLKPLSCRLPVDEHLLRVYCEGDVIPIYTDAHDWPDRLRLLRAYQERMTTWHSCYFWMALADETGGHGWTLETVAELARQRRRAHPLLRTIVPQCVLDALARHGHLTPDIVLREGLGPLIFAHLVSTLPIELD